MLLVVRPGAPSSSTSDRSGLGCRNHLAVASPGRWKSSLADARQRKGWKFGMPRMSFIRKCLSLKKSRDSKCCGMGPSKRELLLQFFPIFRFKLSKGWPANPGRSWSHSMSRCLISVLFRHSSFLMDRRSLILDSQRVLLKANLVLADLAEHLGHQSAGEEDKCKP